MAIPIMLMGAILGITGAVVFATSTDDTFAEIRGLVILCTGIILVSMGLLFQA